MRIEIPKDNWLLALTDAIQFSIEGDTILCHNIQMLRIAEEIKDSLCQDKNITFKVGSK